MFKLVIIDDEPAVRSGLRKHFRWHEYGIEIAGEADDGDSGLELVSDIQPDIVLSDVLMPRMDGVRMATEIRKRYPAMKLIFISGYDDVDYLKSALQLNAVDYIFKPVNLIELRSVVESVTNKLKSNLFQRQQLADMQTKLIQSMPYLREKFLTTLIRDGFSQPLNVRERLDFLELDLPLDNAYWVIAVNIDDYSGITVNYSEKDRQLLSYSVQNICQELIERKMKGHIFEYQNGQFVGVLLITNEQHKEDQLLAIAYEIRDNLHRWLKISVTIGVGEQANGLVEVSKVYLRAKEAADQKWYLGKNRVISMDNLNNSDSVLFRFDLTHGDRLITILRTGVEDRAISELKTIFEFLSNRRAGGMNYCRNIALQIILLANRLALELDIQTPDIDGRAHDLWNLVSNQETIEDLYLLLEAYLTDICRLIIEKRSGKPHNVVQRIRDVIDRSYSKILRIEDIASEIYLTPTYICLLFKQETGETINEYLTKVRMKQAQKLLADRKIKLYEVSKAVGYADPGYFAKLFKKHIGLNPSAFRDQEG